MDTVEDLVNARITPRELEVWKRCASGKTRREIAAEFGTSIKTVDSHMDNLRKKTKVRNAVELTLAAIRFGIIKVEAV